MINFFRNIRGQLLAQNKLVRYLIYALGEIILIILGILIALQINNWNEKRKEAILEKQILQEIRDNLMLDTTYFASRIIRQTAIAHKIDLLIHHLEAGLAYHDSLDNYFSLPVLLEDLQIARSGYETLKSLGLEKLKSEKIKNAMSGYYDRDGSSFSNLVEQKNQDNTRSMSTFNKEHFRRIASINSSMDPGWLPTGYKPIAYADLLTNPFYLNYLYERKGYKLDTYNNMMKTTNELAVNLLQLINEELKQ